MILMVAMVASLSLILTGCGQQQVKVSDEGMSEATAPVEEASIAAEANAIGTVEPLHTPVAQDQSLTAEYSEGRTSPEMLPIYFDFDQSNIRDDQRGRIDGNAYYLDTHPEVKIRIEGNCDERGTNEYNIALGERRAIASKKYLINKGISEERMETVSYGEEKPLLYGHDELSWAQNRRDDFVIAK